MTEHILICATSARPIDLAVHRRIRLRRLGLSGATARLIGELAFGQVRDELLLVAVADVAPTLDRVRP